MTTELVLLLGIYAFIIIGVFLGDSGPLATFKQSTPRLAARVERNIAIGFTFKQGTTGEGVSWQAPPGSNP